jgi:beta-lactamase superfamily II metal-dependent hydrolase
MRRFSIRRLLGRGAVILAVISCAAVMAGQEPPIAQRGMSLPPWTPGTLDIHQISTGRGNAAFMRFPGGASMLVDAGDGGEVAYADPKPNGSKPPADWIAAYIRRMLPGGEPTLDYAVVTHFHSDHIGAFAGVSEHVKIGKVIDRGYDYLPPPADALFQRYRAAIASSHLAVERAEPGSRTQIADRAAADVDATRFHVRIVAANDRVWTGRGDETAVRFPALDAIPNPDDRPTENMCSVALRISYGAFDYFTGGDMPGYPVPGAAAWHDLETAVAKAIGRTDVHVVNHHGSIEEENPAFLATLRSRVMVVPAWQATHPSPDVLKRMLSRRVYPEPRDIFITQFRKETKATIGARATQVQADHGHIVIRVEPGGARYWVIVLDDEDPELRVLSTHGPYRAEP